MSLGLGRASLLILALSAGGCVDLDGDFERFVERSFRPDMSAPMPDAAPGHVFDITGRFLVTLSISVSPDQVVQVLADVKLTDKGDGTASFDATYQPLDAKARTPVGSPFTGRNIAVASDGTFTDDQPQVMFPKEANPITGTDLVANVTLHGTIRSKDRFCGPLTGMVTQPIPLDLAGSKFGAIRVAADAVGATLPPTDYSCPAGGDLTDGGSSD